jgi:phage baseplate assembly protein W
MSGIHGSCLAFPIEPGPNGTLRTVHDPLEMAVQFLSDLVETRMLERVMLPEYGIQDRIFAVMGVGFAVQLAAELEEQVKNYLPLVRSIRVVAGELSGAAFIPGFTPDQHRAAISVSFTLQGSSTIHNLVFPTWQLIEGASQ